MFSTIRRSALAVVAVAVSVAMMIIALPAGASSGRPAAAAGSVASVFSSMSDGQRVGQLFMAATSHGSSLSGVETLITNHHIGNVILQGHWPSADSVRAVTSALRARAGAGATDKVGLYLAGDQEGGNIQPFRGAGFSSIPSALVQGARTSAWELGHSRLWAQQLKAVGINVDLAPVADTVPSAAAAAHNPPIGQLRREFSYSVRTNDLHVEAFVHGMQAAGVATAVKHFPGLGRVTANTDTAPKVVDSTTTATDPYLQPFKYGVLAKTRMVMVGLAVYTKIDGRQQAAFSPTIVSTLLRGKLGYTGVVISDSLGAAAAANVTPANQAIRFIAAGGDMMLQTNNSVIVAMQSAVLSKMAHDAHFTELVYAAVKRALTAKQASGLLP